jgi:hypothetical protein
MLRPEIGSPELDLMKPTQSVWRSVRIRAIYTEVFFSDFSKFDTFKAQELADMMLCQIHRIGVSIIYNLYLGYARQSFPGESQIFTSSMNFPGLSLVRV